MPSQLYLQAPAKKPVADASVGSDPVAAAVYQVSAAFWSSLIFISFWPFSSSVSPLTWWE
jgi:hypothetical protein